MNPKKIKWYLGASSFAMIMEQDRKHWLLKTDKTKKVQDTVTGDVFQGRIDNLGSDIIIETEKLYTKDVVVNKGTFSSENVSDVFDLAKSVWSYIPEMNGLHFLRLKSINLLMNDEYHNFRLKLSNVEECYIPIAPDQTDSDVFVYKWYKTSETPILQMLDANDQWTIEQPIEFSEGVTNPVFYFPADEVLQPIQADIESATLTTPLITDPNMIGFPLAWFTCDESNIGPSIQIENNVVSGAQTGSKLLTMGHPGDVYPYRCKLYPATGIDTESVPSGTLSDWDLVCSAPAIGEFNDTPADFSKSIKYVAFKNTNNSDQQIIKFTSEKGANSVTLNPNAGWVYQQDGSYSVSVETFVNNLYGTEEPLIAAFDVRLDENIPFETKTNDIGFAGISMGSSKNFPDQQPRYPHDLTNLEGLPDWIRNNDENLTPQHLSVYAAHNTPFYKPEDQSTRQIAGLIMDPGVERTYDTNFHPGQYKIKSVSVISGGTGYNHKMNEQVVVHGYYNSNDGKFYEELTYVTEITPDPGKLFIDKLTEFNYQYNELSSQYIRLTDFNADLLSDHNRFWVNLNDGSRGRTLFEITSTDEFGVVSDVQPMYAIWGYYNSADYNFYEDMSYTILIEPSMNNVYVDRLTLFEYIYTQNHNYLRIDAEDTVKDMVYGYYDNDTDRFYEDNTKQHEIEPEYGKLYFDMGTGTVYDYIAPGEFSQISSLKSGSANEETYDPMTLTGNHLTTKWLYDNEYDINELMEVRNAQLSGTGDGLMQDGTPWWLHTFTTGINLVLAIEMEQIEEIEAPYTIDDVDPSQIGRVYVLSNDDPKYINNATAKNPKPERTIARICDIPVSVMQLSNISGLAPTSVVDKQYVRSEASYTERDEYFLQNGAKSRWVRPTALDAEGIPIYTGEPDTQSNEFVFDSMDLLNQVDLMYHNDFREITNLNRGVDPNDVSVGYIADGGSGYSEGSSGTIVVGGYSFTYVVTAVSTTGSVLSAEIASNDSSDTRINLANFNFVSTETSSGLTLPYGTSPNNRYNAFSGTGLKIALQIANYAELIPKKGLLFDDLFAFVSDFDGIWYVTHPGNEWVKQQLIAQSYASETASVRGEVSLRDSYINSILPSARTLPVNPMKEYATDVLLNVFTTASSINVVDTNCTPVHVPSTAATSDTDMYDDLTVVDINKLYCRGVKQLHANYRSESAVLQKIKEDGGMIFDSYIFWRWLDQSDSSNFDFIYGVIHRSLNNLQTTDSTSTLPGNNLTTDKYVHTNTQTTIMWNVPHVGPMVWMFDPNSELHEKYYVNAHTRELYVVREYFDWGNIEIIDTANQTKYSLIKNESGTAKTAFNIYTNNPVYSSASTTDDIYQQPGFTKIVNINEEARRLSQPKGSWRLVFPSILETETFKFMSTDGEDPREFTPVKMTILRGSNISNTTDVLNSDGDPVNYKTLLIDENTQTGRVDLRLYDQESHNWTNV